MKLSTCVVLLTFSTFTFANTSLPNNRHISVTSDAQILAMPDIAVIHLKALII
jgi:uncharacterized protein YggE